jgi:DNA polymerase III subunit beta
VKFRVERDVLAEAVAWTARSLPVRPPVPVLAGLLLEAGDSGLSLSGFDYEVSARATIDSHVAEDGRALVSGRLLADICRSLPPRPVDVSTDGSKVILTCATSRFSLQTMPVEDYPQLPPMPATSGTVPGDVFAHAVAQVAVAAGRDDTLPILTGIRLEIENDTVTLAATDRYRLAIREFSWKPEQSGLSAVALVPARTLADTAKAFTGDIEIALSSGGAGEGLIGLASTGRRTTSRLLEGEFPKYRSLLPAESTAVATVERAAFIEAVRRVALVAERNTPVRLTFSPDELLLEAGSGEEAQASESLESRLDGDPIGIAFNPTFLLDALGALDTPKARLAFTTPTKPAVITGAGAEEPAAEATGPLDAAPTDYRYLLMPVRLAG